MEGRSATFTCVFATGFAALLLLLAAAPAHGLPAFARKYGTSCLTCHTIYPKLNPFGEAFRRNGFRFPGIDSDYIKQETVPLGQEAYKKEFPHAVWPGLLPGSVPIAVGFNGQAVAHPDDASSAALADNGATLTLQDLVEEGHVWAGGSFDDKLTFFGELTVSGEGAELELASVRFGDLIGPKHALNLAVGKTIATLSTFGPRSSYLADLNVTPLSVTGLYGALSDSWNTGGEYLGLELYGDLRGRFDYSLGTNAGANLDTRDTENFYTHAGYKIGGVRLDGENSSVTDPMRPWAEKAITLEGFYYRSVSHFAAADTSTLRDVADTFGGAIRAQLASLELTAGVYQERHDQPGVGAGKVHALAQYNELSYVLFPWFVPAVRVEYLLLKPTDDAPSLNDLRIFPGLAMLVRANLKLTLIAQLERAEGAPPGGWGPAGGFASPATPTGTVDLELESIVAGLACAF